MAVPDVLRDPPRNCLVAKDLAIICQSEKNFRKTPPASVLARANIARINRTRQLFTVAPNLQKQPYCFNVMSASREKVAGSTKLHVIDVHLVSGTRGPPPGGIGEPGCGAIAPAVPTRFR